MKKMKSLILFLLLFGSCHLKSQNIDTKHLCLKLQFNWKKKQALGTAEITFSPLSSSKEFLLDAGNLTILRIYLNSKPVDFNYQGGDENGNLKIMGDRIYLPNETLSLEIDYQTNYVNNSNPNAIWGSFGKGLRFQEPTSTTPNKRKQIWSSGEPDGNKYWFPCNDDIEDIHSTEIFATVDNPMIVLGNGILMGIAQHENGGRTFHYKSLRPFPNYLVSIVVGEYEPVIQKSNSTNIQTFGYSDEKEAVKATVELLPKMMNFIEDKIGYKFPYKTYNQVVVQDYPFPGLVGQHNTVILSDNYIDDYGVHKDFKYLWDGVAVQALTAQWFGNLLMPKTWNDIWLNNSFAEYFAGLFTSSNNDQAEYLLWYYYPWEKSIVLGDWQNDVNYPIVSQDLLSIPNFNSNNNNKFRGALVLRMLQHELGEELWWKAINFYVKSNAGKQVETKDFQDAIEKISGKSYQWFFSQWIYNIGMPNLIVSKKYDSTKKELQLIVKQNQSPKNKTSFEQVNYFKGKVVVEIDGRNVNFELKAEEETVIIFKQNIESKYVHFNVNEYFLCEYIFEKPVNELKYQLKNAKDIAAKKQAIDYLVSIANDSTSSTIEKGRIEALFVDEIKSKYYWRYRTYVLSSLQKFQSIPYSISFKNLLVEIIKNENSWLKNTAIFILGNTKDSLFFELYRSSLSDPSDRVVNAAAIAIGKTKSSKAFNELMNLENQQSWKNQNRISALNGLQHLGDDRASSYALQCILDNHSPRWYLATATWDYPYAAMNTLVSLGKANLAYPGLLERFKRSLQESDINDIFQNVQLINLIKDERAKEVYVLLKEKFKSDPLILEDVINYEKIYLDNIK
jgi:aminopeptidase N